MPRIRTHPGEVLSEEFMVPLGLSARRLAEEIGVPPNRISDIVRGHRDVTADTALRLAQRFGTSPQFWMNLQNAHDLSRAEAARQELGATAPVEQPISRRAVKGRGKVAMREGDLDYDTWRRMGRRLGYFDHLEDDQGEPLRRTA